MLTGRLPYGAQMARTRTRSQQRKLKYATALDDSSEIPAWVDGVLKKAVHPDPRKRYEELSEFVADLRTPPDSLLRSQPAPLIARNPLFFWKALSFVLACAVFATLLARFGFRS